MPEDMQAKASRFLTKVEKYGFNEHEKHRLKLLIEHETPTDRAAWEEFMIKMVKDRVCVKFLSDHGLRHVIRAARKNIGKRFAKDQDPFDPDMPECYYWNEEQCANWISISGHPELKEAFLINHICGRKLVALDASALSKMGYRYFDDIKKVTSKIRELLEIPRPNMMRALVRLVPMELFLRKRIYNGRNYNKFTFEKFCVKEGFPYDYLLKNSVNASIAGTSKVLVLLAEDADNVPVPEDEDDDSSGRNSLNDAPSVEFVARNVLIRNKIIQAIIDNLLLQSFLPENQRKYGSQLYNEIMKLIRRGIQAMGMEADDVDLDSFTPEKVKIIQEIGQSLVQEMVRTEAVLRDIKTTRKIIRKDVSNEEYEDMKVVAEIFMEDVLPIAGLLAVGELNLEGMFRGEQNIQSFVTGVVDEATEINERLVPETENFINEIIREAKIRIVSLLYPELPMANIRFVASKDKKGKFLDELIENAFYDYDYQQKTESELSSFIGQLPSLPTPSKMLKSNWGPSPLLSSRDSGADMNDNLKLDPKGIPILDRLNSIELDRLIDTHIIYLNKIPTEIHNQDIIAQAKLVKVNRHTKRAQALSQFNSPAKIKERKFPGKTNEQGIFEEFPVEEKFDKYGVPIVSKLNKEELDDIIINGIVKNDDGLVYVTEEIISAARQEKRRREQMELVGNVRYSNYRRNYPGKIDSSGRYEEYIDKEKFEVSSGTIILSRLTTTELERLVEDGILTLGERTVSVEGPRDKGTKGISDEVQVSLESLQFEIHRRQLETLQDKIRWKAYERKYPGKINKDGDFEEFSQLEKLDSNNLPILSALNDHELEYIVMNGSIQTADGTQHYVDEDVARRARYERTQRRHEQEALDIQFDNYRTNYPGKYQLETDAQGNQTSSFIQFNDNEKIDRLGFPIIVRLNTKELKKIIKTGKFRNKDLSQNQKILHKAKMETDKRAHNELVIKVEQGMKWVRFPGRMVNDQFQSYRLQEKFYLSGSGDANANNSIESPGSQQDEQVQAVPAGQQGYPILDRLNMNELREILESKMIPVMDPVTLAVYKLYNAEILEQVKVEKARRVSEQLYALKQLDLLQDKFMRQINAGKNLNKMKVPAGLGLEAAIKIEFTAEEKYDSNGDPIIDRMTDAEIIELIQTAAKNDTMRSSIVAEAIAEQQNRIDEKEQLRNWKLHNAQVVKNKSSKTVYESRKDTVRPVAGSVSVTGHTKTDSKPQYESIFQRESRRHLQNVEYTPEQQRLETLNQIISLIQTNQSRIAENATQSKSASRFSPDEVGNLALFNGFIVDTDSKVIGTVNPVNGQIQNQTGAVVGSVTPEGRVIVVRDGKNVAIGRLGADIEQKAVGKFRAIPKAIELHISKYLAKSATKIQEDQQQNQNKDGIGIQNERLANWNIFLPLVFGQIVVEEVDDSGKVWLSPVPDSEKESPETSIRLAQQIQVAGGYNPENIILLEDDVVAQLLAGRDKRLQAKAKRLLQKEREQELAIAALSSDSTTESSTASIINPEKTKRRKTVHHHGSKHPAPATEDKAQLKEEVSIQEIGESQSQGLTTDEAGNPNPFAWKWKRREKKHVHRTLAKVDYGMAQPLHPAGASMFKGKSTQLPMVTKGNFIPGTVTWGVKQVPLDEEIPHMFKPPSTTSLPKERKFYDPSEYQTQSLLKTSPSRELPSSSTKVTSTEKIENAALGVKAKASKSKQKLQFAEGSPLAEAKRLIGGDGQVLGEIQKDGRIFSVDSHTYVGRLKKTGVIVDAKGVRMETSTEGGLKLARENGVVVGQLDSTGKVKKTTEVDRFLIGRIWADGRIVTMDDTLIGIVAKDGKIIGAGGKEIGTFTKTWELLGADGVPFAYVSSEGKVYRYEVIPQKKAVKSDKTSADPGTSTKTNSQHAKLVGSKNKLGTGTSSKPRFNVSVPHTIIPIRSAEALIASRITEESTNEEILMDMLERRKQIEAQRKDEESLRLYDQDSKHKTSIKRKLRSATLFDQHRDDVANLEKNRKKGGGKWKDGRSQSVIRDAVEQAEFLKEKIAHRKLLVENWAHEVTSSLSSSSTNTEQYFSVDPGLNVEERQRLVRMAADSIVDDIFKLALTRLLLQAEAGNDTATIMAAMEKIRTTGDDYTTAMWNIDTSSHVLAEYFNKPVDTASKPFHGMSEIGTQEGSSKDYPPLGKGRDRGRSSTGAGHHHHQHRRHSRQSGSVSYTLSLEDHEHQPNHNIHDGHGHHHHHHHHHHRPSEDDLFDFEYEYHHHHHQHHHHHPDQPRLQHHYHRRSLEDDDEFEFEFEDPVDFHHPAHGLGFKHIIKGPDIERIVYAHTPARNLSLESVGSMEVGIRTRRGSNDGHHHHHHQSRHRHRHHHKHDLGGRLPHIAHPGVHAHNLSLEQEREERAEEIHHGKRELETFELPILPQHSRKHDRGRRKGEL